MDVSDFDISSRTDELRNSIDGIPKPLLDEIREALPVQWQRELEDKFNTGCRLGISKNRIHSCNGNDSISTLALKNVGVLMFFL